MPEYRSRTTTHGRNQAGARALWRATGMKEGDFNKPMIAVVNSFTQFVPGHVHLKDMVHPETTQTIILCNVGTWLPKQHCQRSLTKFRAHFY